MAAAAASVRPRRDSGAQWGSRVAHGVGTFIRAVYVNHGPTKGFAITTCHRGVFVAFGDAALGARPGWPFVPRARAHNRVMRIYRVTGIRYLRRVAAYYTLGSGRSVCAPAGRVIAGATGETGSRQFQAPVFFVRWTIPLFSGFRRHMVALDIVLLYYIQSRILKAIVACSSKKYWAHE